MNTVVDISLRNLVRQKRRNFLLGAAIGFGMMILVIANAFAHGMSDTIFNQIIVYVSGHANIGFAEKGDFMRQIFRDGPRIKEIIKKTAPEIRVSQESIGMFMRVIGNDKTDNLVLVGIDKSISDSDPSMKHHDNKMVNVVEGKFDDISRDDIENPVLLSVQKAKSLNVKKGDFVRARFRDVNGHDVAFRLTVVGIFKTSNVFMQMPMFTDLKVAKRVLGYRTWETASLQFRLNNPEKTAAAIADKLHDALRPNVAVLAGSLVKRESGRTGITASAFALKADSLGKTIVPHVMKIIAGDTAIAFGKSAIIATKKLADSLHAGIGDTVELSYKGKYAEQEHPARFVINAICADVAGLDGNVLFVNEKAFYSEYDVCLPQDPVANPDAVKPDPKCPLFAALGTEWILLDRSHNSAAAQDQIRSLGRKQYRATTVNVSSMYESASQVLQLENALNLITVVAVLILFFIILIGVVNTLRMTIRERTREIGTIRAIGMQKSDVRNTFILETFFLSLFSSIAGTIAAFAIMTAAAFYRFPEGDNPLAMILDDQHIRFLPDPLAIAIFFVLILLISVATAYFPARRAANLSAAEALRSYE